MGKGNQQYSFERNRYYPGKMLTSADFLAEQNYFNKKRTFLNHILYGSGIICGLSVFNLDDLSIYVESGVAIDGYGREIVVEKSVVKKLAALEGFDKLSGKQACLCIRYQEETVQPIRSIYQQEEEICEYNRIQEGYELFLTNPEPAWQNFEMDYEFLSKGDLLQAEGYKVEFEMPAFICAGRYVKCIVRITGEPKEALCYEGILQIPGCTTLEGGHELVIQLDGISLQEKGSIEKEYWIKAQDTESSGIEVILKRNSAKAFVGKKEVDAILDFSMKIVITKTHPRRVVDKELGKLSLEMRNMGNGHDFLCLANIALVRTDLSCIIDQIMEPGSKRYIETPAEEMIRKEYLDYFRTPGRMELWHKEQYLKKSKPTKEFWGQNPESATGILEIPVGGRARKGEIRCSGEIMHGLGNGTVYVQVGYEYLEEQKIDGANRKSTIYGNPDLFEIAGGKASQIETAVKVLNDKGSFLVAARFLKEADYLVLRYRWVAFKFISDNKELDRMEKEERAITAKTPTVVMEVRDSYFFDVKFHNMEQKSIGYEVTENGGGEISAEGIYTAPNKEGVFEIHIFCLEEPMIGTYAYAIVKQKDVEEQNVISTRE